MAEGVKTGGRVAGTPNKITAAVKEMVLQALEESGGVEYLKAQAMDNPSAFMTLLGKILPMQLAGDPENPLHITGLLIKGVDPV